VAAGKTSTMTHHKNVPPAAEPSRGKVQRVYVERGFGFIRCLEGRAEDVGQDFFFHMSGLDDCSIHELEEGSLVRFSPTYVAKGKRAEHIEREGA
jgi:cold shock CspA family protein